MVANQLLGIIGGLFKPHPITPISQNQGSFLEENGSIFIFAIVLVVAMLVLVKTSKK